ncbi:MAG: site-2 protease family protein, partial [Firmicutes bacterium]|nr:site-2 protease family protein [Bacillota bacterium]
MIGITPKLERNVGNALVNGAKTTFNMTTQMYTVIKQLFTGEVSTKELSGPVGIVYMVNQSASMGLFYFFYLMAVISLNLAIVNLLPLPALDGGRIVLIGIKKITGKAISDKTEGMINTVGLVLLLTLMVYVTWNDIIKFIVPIFN